MCIELDGETTFAPTIKMPNGSTITPTNDEWLWAFAIRGCDWAIEAIEGRLKCAKG
jgi:hypothetical protein